MRWVTVVGRVGALGVLALAVLGLGRLYAPEPPPTLASPGRVVGDPELRIAVAREASAVRLFLGGDTDLELRRDDGQWLRATASRGSLEFRPAPDAGQVRFEGRDYLSARLSPRDGRSVNVRWREEGQDRTFELFSPFDIYRAPRPPGRTTASTPPGMRVIARVGLETYVAGVLPGEIPANWPRDALMAQAIAARTHALYHYRTREREEWHMGVGMQAWKPAAAHTLQTRMAVKNTSGVVLLERGYLFAAYFSAECGGNTANVRSYVPVTQPVTALSGIRCPRCAGGKARAWRWHVKPAEIAERLVAAGRIPAGKEIAGLDAFDDSVGGGQTRGRPIGREMARAAWIQVRFKDGTPPVLIRAADFRIAVGTERERMSSTWLRIGRDERDPDGAFVFEGRGWGHGVGLCQEGARHMAENLGRGYIAILREYYPGVQWARIYSE